MRTATLNVLDLRDHFLDKEGGSLEALDQNLGHGIKISDTWHNHAIFFYHAVKNALVKESYGTDTDTAAAIIQKHARAWVNKALSFKAVPEPWIVPQTLCAFHMLGVRPPVRYVEFCQKTVQKNLKRWDKSEILSWASSAASLTLDHDPAFIQAACHRLVALAPTMRGNEIYDLARNMAILDATAETRDPDNPKRPRHIARAFDQIFNLPYVKGEIKRVQHLEEPQKLADALYWFSRKSMAFMRREDEQDSGLQFLVKDKFREAGAHPTRRRMISETGHELDLSFHFKGCNFDVEVDGPMHFIRCTDGHIITLDGSSIFQTMLLKERDRERSVVRLPYTVYNDHVDRPQMWEDLCRQIKDAGPGAYLVDSYGHLTSNLLTRCRAYSVYDDAGGGKVSPA